MCVCVCMCVYTYSGSSGEFHGSEELFPMTLSREGRLSFSFWNDERENELSKRSGLLKLASSI